MDQTLFFVLSLADSGCLLVYDRCCNLFNLVFARSQSSSTANEMSNDGLGFLIPKSLGMALGPDTTFVLNVQHRPLLHQWQMLLFKATASLVYHLSVSVRVTDRGGTCGFWLVTSKWFRGCEDGDKGVAVAVIDLEHTGWQRAVVNGTRSVASAILRLHILSFT